jgi:N-acetylneuraminic acid mutarotase
MLSGAYAQEWVSLAPSPEAAEEIYGIASGGKLYGFGGLGPAWTPRGLVYEYDPAADQWTKKKPMALPSHHVALAGWKGKIYLAGGEMRDEKMFGAFRVVEAFDPVANRWTNLPPMAIVRHGHAGAVVGNRLHIVSGDVQSLGGVKPADVQIETDLHDALELPDR